MVAALVLGTGLPTSATYIITAIMAAPALELLGVPKLVAHFFVFYFGILADLTPPTAISTYATASIAGADVWRTQALGMMLSLSGFIIPFAYVYDPALLLIGASVPQIALRTAAATLGVIMLSAALIGYLRGPTRLWERALLLAGVVPADLPRRLERRRRASSASSRCSSHSAPRGPPAPRRRRDGTGHPGLRRRLRARLPRRGRARDRAGDDRVTTSWRSCSSTSGGGAGPILLFEKVARRRHPDHRQRGGQPHARWRSRSGCPSRAWRGSTRGASRTRSSRWSSPTRPSTSAC